MAKKIKPTKGMVIELPADFNRKLKMRVIELEEIGVKKTRAELVAEYAQVGYNYESLQITRL
jgi:hypothetical protein